MLGKNFYFLKYCHLSSQVSAQVTQGAIEFNEKANSNLIICLSARNVLLAKAETNCIETSFRQFNEICLIDHRE